MTVSPTPKSFGTEYHTARNSDTTAAASEQRVRGLSFWLIAPTEHDMHAEQDREAFELNDPSVSEVPVAMRWLQLRRIPVAANCLSSSNSARGFGDAPSVEEEQAPRLHGFEQIARCPERGGEQLETTIGAQREELQVHDEHQAHPALPFQARSLQRTVAARQRTEMTIPKSKKVDRARNGWRSLRTQYHASPSQNTMV